MTVDGDARRRLRVVRVEATEVKPPRSANADAAARYRARQRGEAVPKRKPGPQRATESKLCEENRDLRVRVADLEFKLRLATQRRHPSTLTVERLADELLVALLPDPAERDTAEQKAALRDVAAVIEARHEHWSE